MIASAAARVTPSSAWSAFASRSSGSRSLTPDSRPLRTDEMLLRSDSGKGDWGKSRGRPLERARRRWAFGGLERAGDRSFGLPSPVRWRECALSRGRSQRRHLGAMRDPNARPAAYLLLRGEGKRRTQTDPARTAWFLGRTVPRVTDKTGGGAPSAPCDGPDRCTPLPLVFPRYWSYPRRGRGKLPRLRETATDLEDDANVCTLALVPMLAGVPGR